MAWQIKQIDEGNEDLDSHFKMGWEPFSVTVETRVKEADDDHPEMDCDEEFDIKVIWLRKQFETKMFAIWTEHSEQNFKPDTIISSEVMELKAGMTLASCGDEPTYWKLHSVYDTLEDANAAHQDPHFLTMELA